jgi:mono/diheme cytochrome c family protein
LKTEPGDFTNAETQKQPDGSLFYKTSEGRKDMPSFKKKISDPDDIWSIVNYIRTLKK